MVVVALLPKEWKSGMWADICTSISTAASLTIFKDGDNSHSQREMNGEIMIHTYNGISHSHHECNPEQAIT